MELFAGVFKLLFWILIFLIFRSSRYVYSPHRLLRDFRSVTSDLIARYGGELNRAGQRRLIYSLGNGKEIEVDCFSRPRLIIRLRQSFQSGFSMHRIPRMLYAFIESFLSPRLRINGHPYLISGSFHLMDKPGFLPLFEQLSKLQMSMYVSEDTLVLSKRLRRSDLNEFVLLDLLRKAETLAALCNAQTITIPVQPVESERRCAYCKEVIEQPVAVVNCASCDTPHHSDCFQLNGKCSVFGCGAVLSSPTFEPLNV